MRKGDHRIKSENIHDVISALSDGFSIQEISNLYEISTRSVYRWKRRIKQDPINSLRPKRRKQIFDPSVLEIFKGSIRQFQYQNRRMKISEFQKITAEICNIRMSRSHAHRWLTKIRAMV